MKLRNKDDGRVREFGIDETKSFPYYLRDELGNTYRTKTLKEIADKWEEIEEPKEYWTISGAGYLWTTEHMSPDTINDLRRIGNLFETKEEAEKVVEKLKAFKRLKDKGFRFKDYTRKFDGFKRVDGSVFIVAELNDEGVIRESDMLFRE